MALRLELGPVLRTLRRQPAVFAMLVLEIAAGVATLTALLLAASWYGQIGDTSSGLDEENLVLVSTYTPGAVEAELLSRQAADLSRVRATAGVLAASSVSLSIIDERWLFPALFKAAPRQAIGWRVYADDAAPRALGLRAVAGTLPLTGHGAAGGAAREAVLTRCLAERLYGAPAAALGATIASDQNPPVRVTGVVEDVRMRMPFMPSSACVAFVFGGAPVGHEARLVVRAAAGARAAVVARLAAAFASEAPHRWIEVGPFDSKSGTHHRVGTGLRQLLGFYAALLGLIALLGALAATSFLVAQRRRQIGIRRALGATKGDIVAYFLVENVFTTLFGSLLGLCGAALLFVMMRRFFLDMVVERHVVVAAVVAFWLATLAATLVPALRAARVAPSVATRSL